MLKIKIFAATFAIVMTLLTIYIAPIIYTAYIHWVESLTQQQQQWVNYGQALLGVIVAGLAGWQWRKNRNNPKG